MIDINVITGLVLIFALQSRAPCKQNGDLKHQLRPFARSECTGRI